jgi:hypothetical protein
MRILLLLIVLAPCLVSAQTDSSISNIVFGPGGSKNLDQEIYNGRKHLGYPSSITGIAYYKTSEWQPGTIIYRDVYYPDVFLKYDLVQNDVIVRHFNGNTAITLFTPRIKQFTIDGKSFIHFSGNDKSFPAPGLYEEMGKGKISLYVHRSKYIKETITGLQIQNEFQEKDIYYAEKDGIWYQIKKEKNLLELVKDKRTEVKNDLKKKGYKFRTDPETTLTEIVSYYNKATN